MAEKRNNVTYTLNEKNIQSIRKLSHQTKIPQSRLIDESILDLIKKYEGK